MNRINRNIFMFKDNHNCLECYRVFRRITCARGRPTGTDSCTRLWSTSTRWDWRHSMRTSRKSRWNWPTGNKHFWVRWERRVLSWHGIEDLSLKSENLYLKYYRERMLFCKRKKSWFEKPFTCNIFYAVQNFLWKELIVISWTSQTTATAVPSSIWGDQSQVFPRDEAIHQYP